MLPKSFEVDFPSSPSSFTFWTGGGGNGRMKPHSLIQREAFWSLYFILVFDKVYTFTRSHRIIYALQFLPCAWRAVPIFRAKNQIKHSSFMKSLPTFFLLCFSLWISPFFSRIVFEFISWAENKKCKQLNGKSDEEKNIESRSALTKVCENYENEEKKC